MNCYIDKINEMILGIEHWLECIDYNYIECNYVPSKVFTNNHLCNTIIRSFFRLSPINFRKKNKDGELYPYTPQSLNALAKAYCLENNQEVTRLLYERLLTLRSPKTKHFAIKQGIRISVRLYEDSEEEPTPLNTIWFGELLLNLPNNIISESDRKSLLLSICDYIIEELGYKDYDNGGIYFYYGPSLKKEIYNASAKMSSFILKVGALYSIYKYKDLGEKGIYFIISRQNGDGSWFYAAPPSHPYIDCFHQSYILQALIDSASLTHININKNITKGITYYYTLFKNNNKYVMPIRYDKRYNPKNSWIFQKIDGRDISEALIFFSKYHRDDGMVTGLINLLYDRFYNKRTGTFACEKTIFGMNNIPYLEFQGWFLYALQILKKEIFAK